MDGRFFFVRLPWALFHHYEVILINAFDDWKQLYDWNWHGRWQQSNIVM
jgi:hypothetical protein